MIGNEFEHAVSTLAIQSLLVKKGLCSYEELLEATNGARIIMEDVAQELAHIEPEAAEEAMARHISRIVDFIGGTVDLNKLKEVLK